MEKKITLLGILIGFIVVLAIALYSALSLYLGVKADRDRLKKNQTLLLHNGAVEISETESGKSRASTPSITLHPNEFQKGSDTLMHIARDANIKPKRINEAATVATMTTADITTKVNRHALTGWGDQNGGTVKNINFAEIPNLPADSTPLHRETLCIDWHDPWISLSGCISDSLFNGKISSNDTLDIIVHRIPKRFLFFRFGCREIRMDIISRNPHTKLTYARYYRLVK